jgi:phosphopantothenoylcysteine decarboxylase/phosphopantothenate--cysteine ligase
LLPVRCVVTAGPTYEPLDEVRRLTNFSTGRLGAGLANALTQAGHEVTLLRGQLGIHHGETHAWRVETFSTTANLRERLRTAASEPIGAIFHAAAVSDFTFGKVWTRSAQGELTPVDSGKLPTRQGILLAELVPTPKIIAELRDWYPRARLVGWKYEVEGGRSEVVRLAANQVAECRTDACVANGPAYGIGFGLVRAGVECAHLPDPAALFKALVALLG